ncbi:MAG: PhoH family protein [Elusimicrobiota bacterium]|jgi:phosphate starvation-inducible protein PhoH and related proteins
MVTKRLGLSDQEEAFLVFGQHDKNLKELERRFGVQIFLKPDRPETSGGGMALAVRGRPRSVDQAVATLQEMKRAAGRLRQKGNHDESVDVPQEVMPGQPLPPETVLVTVTGRPVRAQTPQQRAYVQALQSRDMVVAIGPAGTGKTFLAVATALAAFQAGHVSRIVLTRPVVEAGEKLGFLPGDFHEKVHPYLKPLYDAFYFLSGPDRFHQMRDEESIEIVPLAYMRGRTLDDAFIILDEGQNTTPPQMKMFLTRMGNGSKVVITGDVTQIDLEKKDQSGLLEIQNVLKDIPDIAFVRFTGEDVVRHGLVRKIIAAYDRWEGRGA